MTRKKLELVPPLCKKDGCPLKGEAHPKCRAHKRNGQPCGQSRMSGQFVCRMHGGNGKEALERGQQRQALTRIQELVMFNADDDEPVEVGLLREVRWSSQVAQALGEAVAALQTDDLTQSGRESRRLNVLIEAWTNERKLHAQLAKMALDAGIAQRQIELAEQQAAQVVHLFVAVLSDPRLALTAESITLGKQVAAEHMRALPRAQ